MGRAPDQRKTVSVFDFLYVDHRRIGLYLSQFSDFGNLTNIVHSRDERSGVEIKGGVPGVASGSASDGQSSAVQRHFDPQWAQVLNFLDETNARGLLRRKIGETPVGGLLLVPGSLFAVNMQAFEKTWGAISEEPDGRTSGNRRERRAARKSGGVDQGPDVGGLRILASLEQPIFAILKTGEHRIWSTLSPDYLIGGAMDMNLKHGLRITGEWHVLGVLDCEPGAGEVSLDEMGRLCGGGGNVFSDSIVSLWSEFRQVFGRPEDCWGVTPLAIFREIGR